MQELWNDVHPFFLIFMFVPCISSIKALFIVPTDAHNYKITGILKQLKFRLSLRHVSVQAGTIIREPFLCLAKTTVWFYILVVYDVVNVMAAYQSVVRLCGVPHNRLVCCHDIDHVIKYEDIEP
jgi:hypothetical protein